MKKIIEIILQHGWAFDNAIWDNWKTNVQNDKHFAYRFQTPNRGYFFPRVNVQNYQRDSDFKILVIHSFGLHLIPQEILSSADLIVLISTFFNFHGKYFAAKKTQEISQKRINLMLNKFNKEPFSVLNNFYKNCYHPDQINSEKEICSTYEEANLSLLLSDLNLLNNADFIPSTKLKLQETLILHGREDQIVNFSHAEYINEQFSSSNLILFESIGHSLPFSHSSSVWNCILNKLESMALKNA